VGVGEGDSGGRGGRRRRGVIEGEVLSRRSRCGASEGHRRVIHHCCPSEMIG
jgi:hypothetical protein